MTTQRSNSECHLRDLAGRWRTVFSVSQSDHKGAGSVFQPILARHVWVDVDVQAAWRREAHYRDGTLFPALLGVSHHPIFVIVTASGVFVWCLLQGWGERGCFVEVEVVDGTSTLLLLPPSPHPPLRLRNARLVESGRCCQQLRAVPYRIRLDMLEASLPVLRRHFLQQLL
jgi:hypothetical protein